MDRQQREACETTYEADARIHDEYLLHRCNVKHVKRLMKRMHVFMMNICSIADRTAYQSLFSMFPADHLLFHS